MYNPNSIHLRTGGTMQNTFERIMVKWVAVCEHGRSCAQCCWPWKGGSGSKGYPQVTYQSKTHTAHHLLFALYHNIPLTEKFHGCHTCDMVQCCNYHHVYRGSDQTNHNDRTVRNRQTLGRKKGEQHSQAKLTLAQVEEARRLRRTQFLTIDQLAKKYNISHTQMHRIISNKKWKT